MSIAIRRQFIVGVSAVVALLGLLGSVVAAVPAAADPAADYSAALDLGKTVDKATVAPGQTFTYTLTPACSSGDCLDATVVDTVPAQFDQLTLNPSVVVTGSPASYSWGGADDRTLTVHFTTPAADDGVELPSGDGPSIQFSLTVPGGLSPDWAWNNVPVTNTAEITASDAAPVSASATTTIAIPYNTGVATTAGWSPSSTQFKVGELSTLTVGVRNTSNAIATSLTAVLPSDPAVGGNLFDRVDLSALGAVTFPSGADLVQVDAYVAGVWKPGVPASAAALPDGVSAADVTGLRVSFTSSSGATLAAGGSAGSLAVVIAQRAVTRTTSTNLVTGTTASAAVTGTVSLGSHGTATSSANASYVIGGLTSAVTGVTSFTPNRIPAGVTSTVSLSGKNTSNGPLARLILTEPAAGTLFGDSVRFDGFAGGGVWPSGATAATISWFVDTGTAPTATTIAKSDPFPATPALASGQHVTGFSIEFTGVIAAGTTATVPFRVAIAADAVASPSSTLTVTNTARIDGHNDAGDAAPATPSGILTVFYPKIDVAANKTITPSAAVPAGGRSIVQLTATTNSDTAFVSPREVIITDQADPAHPDYWDAFDVVAVAPTQVSAGATLVVSTTTDGSTWTVVDTFVAGGSARVYQTALSNPASIAGIRFDFTNSAGFAQAATLQANVSFVARATLRDTGDAPSSVGSSTAYPNSVTVTSIGDVVVDGAPVTATKTAAASASVKTLPGGAGASGLMLSKAWLGSATTNSQSAQPSTARVSWGTEIGGYTGAVVQEPQTPGTTGGGTVFQAFDLFSISKITPSTDPYMAFDQVTKVELFNGSTWTPVGTCTTASNNPCQGMFPGYTLTPEQRASTIGVRLTFAPDDARRGSDPLAPPAGSGITSGPTSRPVDFVFGIRNKVRDVSVMSDRSDPWVTGQRVYNNTDTGSVRNTAGVTMTPATGDPVSASGSDAIQIIDFPPTVSLSKTTGSSTLSIPVAGDVDPAGYPTNRFTLTASNASAAKAWYLRVTDQMPCSPMTISECAHAGGASGAVVNPYAHAVYDASTNPFEDVTITKISYSSLTGTGIDAATSTVTLWHADGTTTEVPLNSATLTTASALADVVGVSALYTGTSTADGGTIVNGASVSLFIDTQLRKYLRSQPAVGVRPTTLTNSAFAESWDGVLDDSLASAYAAKSVTVTLDDAALAIAATKTFSAGTILEKDRADDLTVTLHADSSTATASPTTLTVSDTTAGFWNTFELRSLPSFAMPAGAASVEVDVQLNGSSNWTTGDAAATASLPTGVTASQVTGIRFVFTGSTAHNGLFSTAAPAGSWTVDVPLTVRVRAALRDSGAPVVFPSTVSNQLVAVSAQDNVTPKTATSTASVSLAPGTFVVDISKTPDTPTSPAGQVDNFTLVMTNTGTGFLDNPVVVDTLPADGALVWDPTSEITYTDSTGGILPLIGQTVAYSAATGEISISWPRGSRLAPGEKYTMVLPIQLQAGLPAEHGAAENKMTFSSDRTLASCTNNASRNGQHVTMSGMSCTTQNTVSTISASAISSFKGVKGDVDSAGVSTNGAVNVNNAATPCVADSDGYYRNPCAAYSVIGGTDLWKLQVTNGGNVAATSASVVDVLPKPGDVYLRSGAARGSSYRPVFAGGVDLITDTQSAVASYAWQVSTASNPCPAYATDPDCAGAGWVDGSAFPASDYASVTAVRVVFTFAGGTLPPAATIAVNYKTVNAPSLTSTDQLAPTGVPVSDAQAWNSFGVHAAFGSEDRIVEPIRAGVQLATGPIQVTKTITGDAAEYAPTSFTATVSCTVAGAPVTMPNSGRVTLAASNATPYAARIDGIPLGADCRIVESTASASTASSVSYAPLASTAPDAAEVTVAQAASGTDPVPDAQQATITNSYGTTQLTITKKVSTTATVGSFGPFAFDLACTVNTGTSTKDVPLAADDASFSLAADGTKTVTGLPVTARCALTETDSDGATSVRVAVDGGSPTATAQGAPVAIALGTHASYAAVVTNVYDGGTLAVSKTVAGSGAGLYGSGPFTVEVDCSYDGQSLFSDSAAIAADQTVSFGPVFPVGTQCSVQETDAGGATTAAPDTSVTIPGPSGDQTVGAVTASLTNTFSTGTFEVDKVFAGAGVAEYGAGPFTAQVSCSWEKGVIPLPDSGIVTLDAAHGYTASVTGLIAGASCTAVETATGGATSTTVAAASPAVVPVDGTSIQKITNRYSTGSLTITKAQDGEGRSLYGDGSYTASVSCWYLSNGDRLAIDLGSQATLVLSPGHYAQTIHGLLVGASCTVVETDAGYAVSSSTDPVDGTVTIPARADGPAEVTITNTFLLGSLSIDKKASAAIVQGGSDFDYTFDVRNTGHVDAAGVTIVDVLDPDLSATSLDAPGWTACAVTGADTDGYGGTLNCVLDTTLAVGGTAPLVTLGVSVRQTIAKDDLPNRADVSSTTHVVTGDDDEVTTPVKWLDASVTPLCHKDAPYLDYSVDARNVDLTGKSLKVEWLDATDAVVHTDTVTIDGAGLITGRLLWPGATVSPDGTGIGWPGWRAVGPGETPTWENLLLDPTLPSYGLRSGAKVRLSINPTTTLAVVYPPAMQTCAEASGDPSSELWVTKKADAAHVAAGAAFSYTMTVGNNGLGAAGDVDLVDPVPASLRIVSVEPVVPADASTPSWSSCVVTDRLASGYGGTVNCLLDRPLGAGVTAPAVILTVILNPKAGLGTVMNTAHVTAVDLGDLSTLVDPEDSAIISTSGGLALTGTASMSMTLGGLLLLLLGIGVTIAAVVVRRRPSER